MVWYENHRRHPAHLEVLNLIEFNGYATAIFLWCNRGEA